MLKQLRISNLILIDAADLHFEKGFIVLSGETGAGKSAVLHALSLLSGEKADTGLIRHGCDKACIEATFEIDSHKTVQTILEEAGIEHNDGEELILRREININGKSKNYVNNHLAQLPLIRNIGSQLFEIVTQHASRYLTDINNHRRLLDTYGGHLNLVVEYNEAYKKTNEIRKTVDELIKSEAQRLRNIEICRNEIEELEEADIKENEETELFQEYTLLSNSEELSTKIKNVYSTLNGEGKAIISQLQREKNTLETLMNIDSTLEEQLKNLDSVILELQEIAYSLQRRHSKITFSAERYQLVNERLSLINRIKRKYGPTFLDVINYLKQSKERLQTLENTSEQIESLQQQLKLSETRCDQLAKELTDKRYECSALMEKSVISHLKTLNMHEAGFHIKIAENARNNFGDDLIEFFFSPNIGEKQIPIRTCASGGEMSRIQLSLQCILAGQLNIPTLIFDEIDSNIGGETASAVGQKLNQISKCHQVICITHFPQVASQADFHWQIFKQEKAGRTHSQVKSLCSKGKEKELSRMRGETFFSIENNNSKVNKPLEI